ncbi:MAG: hypothetical protein LUG88_05320 [Clostridia bacterium]|nr:hypothetical protein [Clostridia bacterium]
MKEFLKKRIAAFVSLDVLALSYGIIGSYPVYELHHMKEWPFDLFIFGVIVIAIAGLAVGAKFTPSLTAVGYAIGFIAGYLFQYDYVIMADSDGNVLEMGNSLWIIWTYVFVGSILAGIIIDAAVGVVKKIKSKGGDSGKTADEAGA